MSGWLEETTRVIPAHVEYLTIYNPALGITDETRRDQIVFYWSTTTENKRRRKSDRKNDRAEQDERSAEEEENTRLRQIGLAQGMVTFAGY